jgi:uncharacterized MAPEG superfamily protein
MVPPGGTLFDVLGQTMHGFPGSDKRRATRYASVDRDVVGMGIAMTFAYWMILAAALLPYVAVAAAKSAGHDNHAPRVGLAALTGWRQRADWAHRNHFEAFPAFAAAIIVAELTHVAQSRIDVLAGTFVVLRIVYTGFYIADWATLRSVVWALGFIIVLSLFVLSAWA